MPKRRQQNMVPTAWPGLQAPVVQCLVTPMYAALHHQQHTRFVQDLASSQCIAVVNVYDTHRRSVISALPAYR